MSITCTLECYFKVKLSIDKFYEGSFAIVCYFTLCVDNTKSLFYDVEPQMPEGNRISDGKLTCAIYDE